MASIKFLDKYLLHPTAMFQAGSSSIGCYAGYMTAFSIYAGKITDLEGNPLKWTKEVRAKYDENAELEADLKKKEPRMRFGWRSVNFSDYYVRSFTISTSAALAYGLDQTELMEAALQNSEAQIQRVNFTLLMFGDNIRESMAADGGDRDKDIAGHGWLPYFAKAGVKLGLGHFTASPAVTNTSHGSDQRLCQAWFWVPPKYMPVCALGKSISSGPVGLARDLTTLQHNLKTHGPKLSGIGSKLTYNHNPDIFELPETEEPAPAPVKEPVLRTVRRRISKAVAAD
jgi:hypothetical protein